MTETLYKPLVLRKNEDRRLRQGHLWVFSNEVDTARSPLKAFAPGEAVEIRDHRGKPLGTGYVNPNSLISARLVSRDPRHPFDASLIVHRLKVALALRERLYRHPYYRLVYGESDGLPGLVVDRYGPVLVAQITTAGMEARRDDILRALDKVLRPSGVLWRNDAPVRELEGLPLYVETALGEVPDTVLLREGEAEFEVPLAGGQKTGWFYDQADNRRELPRLVAGARVLDLFSYVGGWGIQAALAGAREVWCLDGSADAVDLAARNAELNSVADRVRASQGDAFEALKALREANERFDVVIVDPPAFIKRRKDLKKGEEAYRRLNQLAMALIPRDGFLISCSCSYHMSGERFPRLLHQAARHVDRSLQVLRLGGQSADHPIHPAIPETHYLKAVFARVVWGL